MSDPLVLCYHAVSPTWTADLSVTPEAFERQITGLVRAGWQAMTFTEAVGAPARAKTVAVTFDDAFASVQSGAAPVLEALGVKATVFAPSRYISQCAPLAWPGLDHWQNAPEAGELTPMSWDELGALAERGWEIASHTSSHPRLTSLDDAALESELVESRAECRDRLGRSVTSIAYPYGDVDDRVVEFTRRAGYAAAAALEWPSRQRSAHRVPRIGVYHVDTWGRFRLKLACWRTPYVPALLARRSSAAEPGSSW